MKNKSFEIALSAISTAFAVIFLVVASYFPLISASGWLLASVALMLPLARKMYVGDLLAYLATVGLSLIFCISRFWQIFPFIIFFGLHPLVNALQIKFNINKFIAVPIKAVWFDIALYLFWLLTLGGQSSYDFIDKYIYLVIIFGGTLFFIVYDYMFFKFQNYIDNFIARIKKN